MEWLRDWYDASLADADLSSIVINLILALGLGEILAWHYLRFAQVLSNKRKFARMFVFIAATTLLMITVVKTSLALSLGLVGALSIIRFRTPIKEPEELAYLFLAIAVGVGLGADQSIPTVIVFTAVLLFLGLRSSGGADQAPVRTVLQVTAPVNEADGDPSGARHLTELLSVVRGPCSRVDVRRVDCGAGEFNASLAVDIEGPQQLAELFAGIRASLAGAAVSVIERDGLD